MSPPTPEAIVGTDLPPGPNLPATQQVQQWIERPVEFWTACAEQFGDTFSVQLGTVGTTILFSDPTAVRKIFTLPATTFTCRQYNEHYQYVMGRRSLLTLDGPRHQHLRKLLAPFFQRDQLQQHAATIRELTEQTISGWTVDQPFAVRSAMHELAVAIILYAVFGDAQPQCRDQLFELFQSEIYHDLGAWSPWTRVARYHDRVRSIVAAALRGKTPHPVDGPRTLLDCLLATHQPSLKAASEEEIQDQVLTFLVAGADPTALALAWALHWLAEAPAVQQRLSDELRAAGDAALQAPYLDAVGRESLRMYPVVTTPSGRKLTEPLRLAGYNFPPGVTLLPCTYLIHRRADLYPEPDRFQPERFLQRQFASYEYLPFGGGSRFCVGASLAQLEMAIVLNAVVSRFRLTPVDAGPVVPVRHGTLLGPSTNLTVQLSRRE